MKVGLILLNMLLVCQFKTVNQEWETKRGELIKFRLPAGRCRTEILAPAEIRHASVAQVNNFKNVRAMT